MAIPRACTIYCKYKPIASAISSYYYSLFYIFMLDFNQAALKLFAYGAGTGTPVTKKVKTTSGGSQLLLKDRLENLSLNADANTPGRSPTKGANMAHLLIQALNSKDKNILTTVLFTKNETMIRNTVARLPPQAIIPLLKELIVMLQGKTYA